MNEIFFLLFAFLTVFLSIKLSYYADLLSKTSDVSKALVGGILLAGITSLPEFVTCFSALFMGNSLLAIGDILGSNLFNLFMVFFFDLVFVKKIIFGKISNSHNFVIFVLILNYLILYLYIKNIINFNILSIGLPSVFIIITYIYYLKKIPKFENDNENFVKTSSSKTFLKLVVVALCMIISSIILTNIVNNLSILYPSFSSSFLGAILLGVTTSLPEVVTFYALVSMKSYDIAFSNIIGSCLFNLLVLSILDVVFLGFPIYLFSDGDTLIMILLGLFFLSSCFVLNKKGANKGSLFSVFLSLVVVFSYLFFWISKVVC